MNVIIITLPDFIDSEIDLIHLMFQSGLPILHIRKPYSTISELSKFIEHINPHYYSRITLHDHHCLAQKYQLGGIHLNSRNPYPLLDWKCRLSRSCHSLIELQTSQIGSLGASLCFDYQFLSPIYNSISKQGYVSAFEQEQLIDANRKGIINQSVYALGGVTLDKIPNLSVLGFGGVALLGEPWQMARSSNSLFRNYLFNLLHC